MGRRLRLRRVPEGTLHLVLTLTNRHIKSQIVNKSQQVVVVAAATVEPDVINNILGPEGQRPEGWETSYKRATMESAETVGRILARKAKGLGIEEVRWELGEGQRFVGKVRRKPP